ncbi:fimbria/pilus periplasmic chaperone [Pantoea sp. SIMBA_133]
MFLLSKRYSGGVFAFITFITNIITPSFAQTPKTLTSVKTLDLKLGASRIIYGLNSGGASLSVSNLHDYPILMQGKVFEEDKKTSAPFMITPPISRIDPQQQSRLRIVRIGGQMPDNRETLQWICVTGIPPKNTDIWADNNKGEQTSEIALNMTVSSRTCIKLLVRPPGIKGSMLDAASALKWKRQGNKLTATNPSAFYIHLSSLSVGGTAVSDRQYIAPHASRSYTLTAGASGQVSWTVITDLGGESRAFESAL